MWTLFVVMSSTENHWSSARVNKIYRLTKRKVETKTRKRILKWTKRRTRQGQQMNEFLFLFWNFWFRMLWFVFSFNIHYGRCVLHLLHWNSALPPEKTRFDWMSFPARAQRNKKTMLTNAFKRCNSSTKHDCLLGIISTSIIILLYNGAICSSLSQRRCISRGII